MNDYYQGVVARYDSRARAPNSVVRTVLDRMADVVYPAARAVGLPEASFLFPDITLEKRGGSPVVAGTSWMYW